MPSLAIVIPYYKIEFFEETLKSVALQTDKRFSLHIGNDASPHDPLPLIQKYFPDGNYHYYNYKENLGGKNLAMQWERILENVDEEWFQILGDDDMVSENFVEEFYENVIVVDRLKCNVIKCLTQVVNEKNEIIHDKSSNIAPGLYSAEHFFIMKLQHKINSSLSEHIFRNSIYRIVKFKKYPLAWHSDDIILLDITKDGSPLLFTKTSIVSIRVSECSISGNSNVQSEKDRASIFFYKEVLQLFRTRKYPSVYKDILAFHITHKLYLFPAKQVYFRMYPFPAAVVKWCKFMYNRQFLR